MYKRHHFMLMAAMGAALSAGAGAVAQAYEPAAPVKLHAKHAITGQTCDFDTVELLEGFLDTVADREHWTRSDKAEIPLALEPAPELAAAQVDTTAGDQQSTAIGHIEPRAAMHVNLAIDQLAAGVAPADAITTSAVIVEAPAAAPAEPAAPEAPAATEPAFINTGAAA